MKHLEAAWLSCKIILDIVTLIAFLFLMFFMLSGDKKRFKKKHEIVMQNFVLLI